MYDVIISKQVRKVLDTLPDEFIKSFWGKVNILAENPFNLHTNIDIKPLKGKLKGFFRLRIGNYRFLYEIRKREILIYFFKSDTRGDIY